VERGVDFFDRQDGDTLEDSLPNAGDPLDNAEDASESKTAEKNAIMSTEDLFKMRMEILPQLLYVYPLPRV
jgi:mediator of RNA polymerase II transcription subunit 17